MLYAYILLLVIIYVVCICVVGEIFYMLLVVNCWCKHVLEYVWCGLVKLHEVCFVVSSSSSHTVGLVAFISMLVLNTCVFTIRGVYSGCCDVFVASGATASEMKGN